MQMHDFLKDDDLDVALGLIVKLIANSDVAPQKAPPLIVKVQALSAKYQLMAAMYTTVLKGKAGSEEYLKKSLYYSLSDTLDKLAQSLKYLARQT